MTITIIILLAIVINFLVYYSVIIMLDFTLKKYIKTILSMDEVYLVFYAFLHLMNLITAIFILIAINNTYFHFKY